MVRRGKGGGTRTSRRWASRTIRRARAAVVELGVVERVLETVRIKAGRVGKVMEVLKMLVTVRLVIVGARKLGKVEMVGVVGEG